MTIEVGGSGSAEYSVTTMFDTQQVGVTDLIPLVFAPSSSDKRIRINVLKGAAGSVPDATLTRSDTGEVITGILLTPASTGAWGIDSSTGVPGVVFPKGVTVTLSVLSVTAKQVLYNYDEGD